MRQFTKPKIGILIETDVDSYKPGDIVQVKLTGKNFIDPSSDLQGANVAIYYQVNGEEAGPSIHKKLNSLNLAEVKISIPKDAKEMNINAALSYGGWTAGTVH